MGAFKIEIVGVGGHGCDRRAKKGDKLFARCGRYGCPDCEAYDFVQRLRQKGMLRDGDSAYSVNVEKDTPAHNAVLARIAGREPTNSQRGTQYDFDYWKVEDADLLPPGATYIGVRMQVNAPSGSVSAEMWYGYPMSALFTHWPGDEKSRVIDDMLLNERVHGSF